MKEFEYFPRAPPPPAHELPSQLPDSTTVLRSAAALLKQFARSHPPTPPPRQSSPSLPTAASRESMSCCDFVSSAFPCRPLCLHHRLPRGALDYYRDGTRDSRRTKLLLVTMAVIKGLWSWSK